MPNLIIIDLQRDFRKSITRRLIKNTQLLIDKAKNDNANIVVVEYNRAGNTIPDIIERIGCYDKFHTITKNNDSGAREILSYFKSYGLKDRSIICGVNTYACVYATVADLAGKLPIDICWDACYDSNHFYIDGLGNKRRYGYSSSNLNKKNKLKNSLPIGFVLARQANFGAKNVDE